MTARLGLRLSAFNWHLWQQRQKMGLSQKSLSLLISKDVQWVSRVETLRQKPSREEAEELASALSTTVEELFPLEVLDRYSSQLPSTVRFAIPATVLLLPSSEPEAPIQIDEAINQSELQQVIQNALSTLAPRERKVLELRFGLEDGCSRTLEETGREFHVANERIRQIEAKALRKLRHPSRSNGLKPFIELSSGGASASRPSP